MNRQLKKSVVAATVSLVLVYYSAAWAILHCLDDDHEHPNAEESRFLNDRDAANAYFSVPDPESDCLLSKYQFESLAGSALESSVGGVSGVLPNHVSDVSFSGQRNDQLNNWGKIVFARGSPPPEPYLLPLYLSVSSLRI